MARPTTYKAEYCEEVIELMSQGYSDVAICDKWNISRDTFYRWQREKPEFKEAVETGQPKYQNLMEQLGFKGMMGEIRGFQAGMWHTLMKAKCKDYKEDKTSQSIQANTVNILNNFDNLTTEKLLHKVQNQIRRNPELIELLNESREPIKEPISRTSSEPTTIRGPEEEKED